MGTASNGSRITMAAVVAALVLSACGTVLPTDDDPRDGGPVTSAPVEGSAAASALPTPHPFAGEGDWIAYQTNRGGAEGIWFIHPDGTEDHEVALNVPGEHRHPDWFPDGTELLLTSRTETADPLRARSRDERGASALALLGDVPRRRRGRVVAGRVADRLRPCHGTGLRWGPVLRTDDR